MTSLVRCFYRMTVGYDSYLVPCEITDRIDGLYEIRYKDPFYHESDGSEISVTKIVDQSDLAIPHEL